MALTPEDVVNKRFQPTKFREGYDQDEVDDFLDEVVVELRRLNQENEELRQRLIASDSRINELQRSSGSSAPSNAAPSFVSQQPAESFSQPPTQAFTPVPAEPEPAPVVAEPAAPVAAAPAFAAPAAADPSAVDPNNTNNLLQLARRLHEEHVREGVEKRDALIAEGQEQANRVVAEAEAAQREKAQEVEAALRAQAQEAEAAQRAQLAGLEAERTQLEQERTQLEGRVEELRNFEREYRQKLKGYIEGQLRELDATNSVAAASAPTGASAPSSQPYAAPAAQSATPNFTGFAGTN